MSNFKHTKELKIWAFLYQNIDTHGDKRPCPWMMGALHDNWSEIIEFFRNSS